MYTSMKNSLFTLLMYSIWLFGLKSEGFINKPNQNYKLQKNVGKLVPHIDYKPRSSRGRLKRSSKTEVSRNQSDSKDRFISIRSRPKLIIRRGQAQFKTKDHGNLANLPYKVKKDGRTSTLRTEENIIQFTDAVEKTIRNPNSIWFDKALYQDGTKREVKSINIYNVEEKRVAVFKRSTGEFITFCQPRIGKEETKLLETGNFGGKTTTPIDNFDRHVRGTSPNPTYEFSSVDERQKREFTPLNSFESDVMRMTPLDPSSLDYQI